MPRRVLQFHDPTMHLVVSLIVSFLMLIAGLALLVVLQSRGLNPVATLARPFTAAAPAASTPAAA